MAKKGQIRQLRKSLRIVQRDSKAPKNRRCDVRLPQLHKSHPVQYENALLHKYGIRNCFVRIERMNVIKSPKKMALLSTSKVGSVRKHVSWLPSKSSTEINSALAMTSLAAYQNNVIPSSSEQLKPKPSLVKRQLAISKHAERAKDLIEAKKTESAVPLCVAPNYQKESTALAQKAAKRQQRAFSIYGAGTENNITIQDMQNELLDKIGAANRGLKQTPQRIKGNPKGNSIFDEFQAVRAAKYSQKDSEFWSTFDATHRGRTPTSDVANDREVIPKWKSIFEEFQAIRAARFPKND